MCFMPLRQGGVMRSLGSFPCLFSNFQSYNNKTMSMSVKLLINLSLQRFNTMNAMCHFVCNEKLQKWSNVFLQCEGKAEF